MIYVSAFIGQKSFLFGHFEKRKIAYRSFFERITSNVSNKTGDGEIVIKIHTDGEIIRK